MSAAHVAIIGGGLAGLAAAVALADQSFRITLLDRHPRLGGRATSYQLPNGEYIDNCQHVTLRCCTNLEDFYRRIGVDGSIRYYSRLEFTDSRARRGEIRARRLPAPFHLLPSFATYPLLGWKDKRAIANVMLQILRHGGCPPLRGQSTMLDWLRANKQTDDAINRFWRVVLVSALNEELEKIDVVYGISVFWKAFLATPAGFGVGVPAVPLADLYGGIAHQIQQNGGVVWTRCGATELHTINGEVRALKLEDGRELQADYYVAAVTSERLLKLLPPSLRELDMFAGLTRLNSSPITSVHLWLDRGVMNVPFLASVDQTIQWVFNKTMLQDRAPGVGGQYLQVVISASYALSQRSQAEIVELCRRELTDLMPSFASARLVRSVVVRESAATFSPEPGCDRWRPEAVTPVGNLFLAGDWTRTDWPATMESAVRSGYLAAEAILAKEGRLVRYVQPELRPTGVSSWFARRSNKT